ncbi:Stm1p [Saccharomyces cerevisiae EC1118]|uniref:Stm1p n=1 Tax=Saccharomyces cerevisiae (strain Lalvin EC1118 / Prise de mousse) TaxID=643680 RepID=C8ZDC1_YEAS8|nr:Stm1p [Saccharomyces cerevisiae EC1118]
MSNPFDLLGNDVEDADVVVLPPKEIVKSNTSSKKADVPPPSADPSKARKNRPRPSGNEGAIRDKTAGRRNNRSKDVTDSATTKKSNTRRATDRHSRTGKTDTKKKVNQGWGDDKKELSAEKEAQADAAAEIAEDAAEAEDAGKPKTAQLSLQDYLNQQGNNQFNKVPEAKKVELDAERIETAEKEAYVPATKVKNVKSKQLKTKEYLEFDATFVESNTRKNFGDRNNNSRNNFNNRRGGRGARKGNNTANATNSANTVQKNRNIDVSNLPSLA